MARRITQIMRRSLHDELVEQLHDLILNGRLEPGDKIDEQALCERFGVSRTPLREALKVLASAGMVNLTPSRGAHVARITPKEIDELFPIMGALEALAGELACARISDRQIARIRKLHEEMVLRYDEENERAYIKLNQKIHEAIFEAAGNTELTQLYHTILARTHSVRYTAKKSAQRWQEAIDDHEEIIAALEARDGPRLARMLKLHLQHKAAMVYESLRLIETPETLAV